MSRSLAPVAWLALALAAPRTLTAAEPAPTDDREEAPEPARLLDLTSSRAELLGLTELETPGPAGARAAAALRAIEASSVDPARALPERLLVGALSALATVRSELRVERIGTARYAVIAGRARTTVSAREIVDLEDLGPELDRLATFAERAGLRSRSGAELVLLRGALAALDARARLMTPAELAIGAGSLVTRTGGLGADLTMRDGVLRIVEPLRGGPGAKAGLLAGDEITAIDGVSTRSMTFDGALEKIRGEIGSPLEVTILRSGWRAPVRFPLVRGVVEAEPLESRRLRGDVGYLRVRTLEARAVEGLEVHLERLTPKRRPLRGLVLDLRGVSGGAPEAALALVDRFVVEGDLATRASRSERTPFAAHADATDHVDVPMIVLVDRDTAFAAELAASALALSERALVAGATTRGRASELTRHDVGGGFVIELRTTEWLGPGDRRIEESGVEPDLVITGPGDGPAPIVRDERALTAVTTARDPVAARDEATELARRILEAAPEPRRSAVRAAARRHLAR